MLDLIDESLEAFFRATVPLDATDVDVSFEPPEREWSAKLNRPTVNAFLWDIRRSTHRARTGMEDLERNGETVRRMALPVVELRYVVTAWTSDHGDERALLAGLMRAILAHGTIPSTFLAEPLLALEPPSILMARTGEEHVDVFKALEGQLKPGINMVLVSQVDTAVSTPVGPPVAGARGRWSPIGPVPPPRRSDGSPEKCSRRKRSASSCTHRSVPTRVNAAGRFLLKARPGDEVVVETSPPRSAVVPPSGGVRIT